MESKNELKEIDIKIRMCYYFDNIMRAWDIDIDTDFIGILLDEKLNKERIENILIYDISYETSTGAKPLRIRYDKTDGFIKIHNKIRYSVLFDNWCDKICGTIKYLLSKKKSGITDSINHNFSKIKIDSFDSLPIEKILTFYNVIILTKSVVNKNKNEYYYNIILEKDSYKNKSNTEYFYMNFSILYMLYFDRIDVSEGIDVNKKCASKECNICHYWYFFNYSFKFQPNVYNRCHELLMMSMNLDNSAILNIKGSGYCCIVSLISKSEAKNLMQNADITEKSNIIKHKNLLSSIKMDKEILMFGDFEIETKNFTAIRLLFF